MRENGFAIESEIISRATENGLKIAEVPISVSYTEDSSTLNPVTHGVGVLVRIITMISERRPLLFFGIGGAILIAAGIFTGIKVINILYTRGGLAIGTALVSGMLIIIGMFSAFTGVILFVLTRQKKEK